MSRWATCSERPAPDSWAKTAARAPREDGCGATSEVTVRSRGLVAVSARKGVACHP